MNVISLEEMVEITTPTKTNEDLAKKYITDPIEIEAVELTDDETVIEYIGKWSKGRVHRSDLGPIVIDTLEGPMNANFGDFIIKGLVGEYYACKPDAFHSKYKQI